MHILSVIQAAIIEDTACARAIDEEAYVERFCKARPDIDPSDIREMVRDAIASFGIFPATKDQHHTTH